MDAVKEENLKLRSENSVLGQYIENLMQASVVFQATSSPTAFMDVGSSGGEKMSMSNSRSNLGTIVRTLREADADVGDESVVPKQEKEKKSRRKSKNKS